MKRKEQNRAAQRAFRERKEKHVKDVSQDSCFILLQSLNKKMLQLEDKVADLEAKNERAQHENENLRDLLSRLQNENVALKQTSFTFSVPKDAATNMESPRAAQNNFRSVPSPQPVASTSTSVSAPTKVPNPLDWSSLTTFDPAMLNLLDDSVPQPTATEGAMQMDFGFGANTGLASNAPYTTIASNPMFMSFASTFDSLAPEASSSSSSSNNFSNNNNSMGFNFDMNSLTTWPTPSTSQDAALDDLFAGYLTSTGAMDLSMLSHSPASISPVAHHVTPPGVNSPLGSLSSSSSSPSMLGSSSLFTTPRDSPQSDGGGGDSVHHGDGSGCPKTKKELEQRVAAAGASPFAPSSLRKSSDTVLGTMIACAGSNFPKTAKSDKNVEVLSAWRSIRADPKFKVCLVVLRW
jgi:AP-1-like factor